MIPRLVLAELRHRPGRAAFLLAGYASGVAVMVVLLAVGEAMVTQARDRRLIGGGDLLILPAGMSLEMLKAGGTTTLFLGLDQARFIQRQVLESSRGREEYGIQAASPLLESRLVRVTRGSHEVQALAAGEIPSRAAAVGAAPPLLAGAWRDSRADSLWTNPPLEAFYHSIDAFHLPPPAAAGDSTWAEWHYFNVVLDEQRWLYLTYMLAGSVGTNGDWGGRLLLTLHEPRAGHVSFTRDVAPTSIRFDTASADLTLDARAFVRQREGVYHLLAEVEGVEIDLRLRPARGRFFPPADLGGEDLISGYVVPALFARAEGRVCLPSPGGRRCEDLKDAPAYHDHNWGVWRDVSWEWGAASDDELSLLYGVVQSAGAPQQRMFAYLVDDRGVRGLFRPTPVEYTGSQPASVAGKAITVPTALRFEDSRRGLSVEIAVESFQVTDMERAAARYFVQMRGTATVAQAGFPVRELRGFFETYVE